MPDIDPIQEAIDEQYPITSTEDSGVDEGADEAPSASSGEDSDSPAWLSAIPEKFQGDPAKLAEAYKQLESRFHQENQPAETGYEDGESEPFWMPGYTTEEAQQLYNYALSSKDNAKQAFEYAEQHPGEFGVDHDQVSNELFQLWQAQDPRGAARYVAQQELAEMRASMQQEFEPLQQQYSAQAVDLAVQNAVQSMPGFSERTQAVLDHIQNIPGLLDRINNDPAYRSPEAITGLLRQAFANVMLEEYMGQVAAQNPNTTQPTTSSAKPKTASRSTTAKPASDDVFDELFGTGAFAAAD